MNAIISLLTMLNSLSPLAVIALLGLVIYMLVKGKQQVTGQVADISDNHLHSLPEIAETLRRMETRMAEDFSWIKAKLNGGGHD